MNATKGSNSFLKDSNTIIKYCKTITIFTVLLFKHLYG